MTKSILLELGPLLLSFFHSRASEANAAILTVYLLAGLSESYLELSVINQRHLSSLVQKSAHPPNA